MATLVYTVSVKSDTPEDDEQYLFELSQVFMGITEKLRPFGFTDDECISTSDIRPFNDLQQ